MLSTNKYFPILSTIFFGKSIYVHHLQSFIEDLCTKTMSWLLRVYARGQIGGGTAPQWGDLVDFGGRDFFASWEGGLGGVDNFFRVKILQNCSKMGDWSLAGDQNRGTTHLLGWDFHIFPKWARVPPSPRQHKPCCFLNKP